MQGGAKAVCESCCALERTSVLVKRGGNYVTVQRAVGDREKAPAADTLERLQGSRIHVRTNLRLEDGLVILAILARLACDALEAHRTDMPAPHAAPER